MGTIFLAQYSQAFDYLAYSEITTPLKVSVDNILDTKHAQIVPKLYVLIFLFGILIIML
jgi:hypothetical protein